MSISTITTVQALLMHGIPPQSNPIPVCKGTQPGPLLISPPLMVSIKTTSKTDGVLSAFDQCYYLLCPAMCHQSYQIAQAVLAPTCDRKTFLLNMHFIGVIILSHLYHWNICRWNLRKSVGWSSDYTMSILPSDWPILGHYGRSFEYMWHWCTSGNMHVFIQSVVDG